MRLFNQEQGREVCHGHDHGEERQGRVVSCFLQTEEGSSSIPSVFNSAHSLSEIDFMLLSHSTHSASTCCGVRSPEIFVMKVARDGHTTTAMRNAFRTNMLCRSLRTKAYASRTAFWSVSYSVILTD